jgi:hypothetical protein
MEGCVIDLTCTRDRLLGEIDAPAPLGPPLAYATDPGVLAGEARLLIRGHTRKELFALLKVVLSERFIEVPRPQLIRDLLVPLKNALGNAWKHGNHSDPAKSIQVECVFSRKGCLIAIGDEGSGFDVRVALRRVRDAGDRGAGFRNLARAHSLVSYEDGGRTVLLCFRPEMEGLDAGACGTCIAAEIPELRQLFRQQGATLEACHVYPGQGRGSDGCGMRYILQIRRSGAGSPETRILTGKLHASEAEAEAEFNNATRLGGLLCSRQFLIPRAVARPASEPRLVLHDFDPWLNLGEYFADRGTTEVIRHCSERVGQALAMLHQSRIPLPEAGRELFPQRIIMGLEREPDLLRRFRAIVQCIERRLKSVPPREPVPVHGALRWHSIHYGVDGRFYLHGLGNCRLSDPALDLGAFLADLRLFTAQRGDEEAWRLGCEAFLGSYNSVSGAETNRETLRAWIAVTLVDRLEGLLSSTKSVSAFEPRSSVPLLISQCERVLDGSAFG